MTPEEQAAAEAAEAVNQQNASEEGGKPAKTVYTQEEINALHPTAIDLEKVDPKVRPIVEKTIKEYKSVIADQTKKAQELAELKRKPAEPEKYFDDSKKDGVFKEYLQTPGKVLSDINSEIANLEAIIPDDGADEYRKARKQIAYWNGIKDEFSAKRIELSEQRHRSDGEVSQLHRELGEKFQDILDYAKTIGLTEKDLRAKPELITAIKTMYAAANPGEGKEIKQKPHQAAKPSGQIETQDTSDIDEELNLSVSERIAISEKRRGLR